jgi:hypothetical protein
MHLFHFHFLTFLVDSELLPVHQTGVRRRCLQEWNLPDDRALQRGPINSVAAESTALSNALPEDPNKRKVNPGKLVTTKKRKRSRLVHVQLYSLRTSERGRKIRTDC